METKTGKLTGIDAKVTKTGSPMWTIHIDNYKFNVFDVGIADGLVVGDIVEYTSEVNDKGYKNLKTLTKASSKASFVLSNGTPQISSKITPAVSKSNGSEYHLTIEQVRSNALHEALTLRKPEEKGFFELVKYFEHYIMTGEERVSEEDLIKKDKNLSVCCNSSLDESGMCSKCGYYGLEEEAI